ncbi:MAG TPA: nuclear transport factor 2 family protein, partial [Aestuariivirga sp.]|nr:nuclear transport factor 2 family protein [Aestuariivirga sp.]
RGKDQVRQGFTDILAYDRAVGARVGPLAFSGTRLFVEWAYDTVTGPGDKQVTRGIDIIEFRDGLISLKEAFRKAPAQQHASTA